MEKLTKKWKIKIIPEKTQAIAIGRRKKDKPTRNLIVRRTPIERKEDVKYLGKPVMT